MWHASRRTSISAGRAPSREAIKVKLIALGDAIDDAGDLGDDFMLQNYYPEKDQVEIQKYFGSGFGKSLVELSIGQWHGPIQSGYGAHLVYVSNISEPATPVFDEVRERVEQDWKMEKGEELNDRFYANLRKQYTVVIEGSEDEGLVTFMQEQAP